MNITPPLGYGPIIPLRREMRVRESRALPAFAAQLNVLPLTASEVPVASHEYPVMFVKIGDTENYALVAVLGWTHQENLFIEAGSWLPNVYIPAYVRRYPFCMTRIAGGGNQPIQIVVSVEEAFVGDDGTAMFDADGNATARFKEIHQFLNEYENDLEHTRELSSIFSDFKLFEHTPMQAKIGDRSFVTQGLYRIDDKRLELLNANQLKTLLKKGGLATIFQHLGSMSRFNRLVERKAALLAASAAVTPASTPA